MSESSRLAFALANLEQSDWHAFEQFASTFLAAEYPDLRVVAGTGDKGRDAVFQDPSSSVIVQYSIEERWRSKILGTIDDLRSNDVAFSVLVYATNRNIGPKGDELKQTLRGKGVELDFRDDTWFLVRVERSADTRGATRDLCARIVDPLIPRTDAVRNSPLDTEEMKAGLQYLELLLHDADGHRSLTKLAYESVVLGTLAATGPENRRTRRQIRDEVAHRFPGHQPARLSQLVDGAIQRLNRAGRVTYQKSTDSFALHYAERTTLVARAAQLSNERVSMRQEIALVAADCATELELPARPSESEAFLDVIEGTIEALLQRQGNAFVSALEAGESFMRRLDLVDLARSVIYPKAASLVSEAGDDHVAVTDLVELDADSVTRLLVHPGEAMQAHLRRLADSYTLLAFLQQTPDVQRSVSHLFSRGRLVLDTSAILPVFVETGLASEERLFTNLLLAARSAGIQLFVTNGVLNEIETHLGRSLSCARQAGRWHGEQPFVYQHWLRSWPGTDSFESFVGRFMGADPITDLFDFLGMHVGIAQIDLSDMSRTFGLATVGAVTEIWRERKQRRHATHLDEMSVDILVNHDVEMYLGVLGLRTQEKADIHGHEAWLVTQDSAAFRMRDLAANEGIDLPASPAMHPNFLANLLGIGPSRATIEPSLKRLLPVAVDIHEHGWGIPALAAAARRIREQNTGQPEYVIRRKLREAMDRLKSDHSLFEDGLVASADDLIDLADPVPSSTLRGT